MRIEIDTSSRLDQSGDTVFGFSNHVQKAIILKQATRDKCLERLVGKKLKKELRLFAASVYLLIRDHLGELGDVTIDLEYSGHEQEIRWIILNMIKGDLSRFGKDIRIRFRKTGRKSPAHEVAWKTFRKERKPDGIISATDVLSVLLK